MKQQIGLEKTKFKSLPTLFIEEEGKKRYLHSKYDPVREAKEWAFSKKKDKSMSYIIFGGGLWYHVEELLRLLDQDDRVFVIEPNKKIFDKAAQEEVYTRISTDPRLTILSVDSAEIFAESFMEILEVLNFKKIQILKWNYYDEYYPQYYRLFIQKIKEYILLKEIDINTTEKFAIEHMENVLSNIFFMKDSTFAMHFRNFFKGKSAVVVSAGPSLDKNIECLKGNEDKVLIISGGRTLKTLLERGIKPHFVVSIDPSYRNFMLLEDVLESDVPMVNTLLSNKEIAKNYKGDKIFLNNSGIFNVDSFFYDQHIDTLSASGTVATLQMSFAEYLGCSKIALIGQDLAYTDNKFHADSTSILSDEKINGNSITSMTESLIPVRGSLQETVMTSELFLGYIKMFENQIKDLNEVTVYDCTEGGAYIEGTKVLPLNIFLEKHLGSQTDFYTMIQDRVKQNKNQYTTEQIKKKIHDLEKLSYQIIRLSKEGLAIIENNIRNSSETEKDIKRLEKIDKKIIKLTEKIDVAEILVKALLVSFEDIQIDRNKSDDERSQDIRKLTRSLYALVQGIYKSLDIFLKKQLEEIKDYENKLSV